MWKASVEATKQAEKDLQETLDAIHAAQLAREKAEHQLALEKHRSLAKIEEEKQKAYAESVKEIMASISPDLVAALNAQANADIMNGLGKSIAPYAMANGGSVADAVSTLVRGTTMEDVLTNLLKTYK